MESFDYEAVQDIIMNYRNLVNQMDDVFEDLNKIGKKLESGTIWNGQAADYFTLEFKSLLKNTDNLLIATKNIYLFLEKVSDNYCTLEGNISKGL